LTSPGRHKSLPLSLRLVCIPADDPVDGKGDAGIRHPADRRQCVIYVLNFPVCLILSTGDTGYGTFRCRCRISNNPCTKRSSHLFSASRSLRLLSLVRSAESLVSNSSMRPPDLHQGLDAYWPAHRVVMQVLLVSCDLFKLGTELCAKIRHVFQKLFCWALHSFLGRPLSLLICLHQCFDFGSRGVRQSSAIRGSSASGDLGPEIIWNNCHREDRILLKT
jgi:hypothetical protein